MAEFVKNVSRFDLLGIFMWGALAGVVVWLVGRAVVQLGFAGYDVGIGASNVVACWILLAFLASITIFTFTAGIDGAGLLRTDQLFFVAAHGGRGRGHLADRHSVGDVAVGDPCFSWLMSSPSC